MTLDSWLPTSISNAGIISMCHQKPSLSWDCHDIDGINGRNKNYYKTRIKAIWNFKNTNSKTYTEKEKLNSGKKQISSMTDQIQNGGLIRSHPQISVAILVHSMSHSDNHKNDY